MKRNVILNLFVIPLIILVTSLVVNAWIISENLSEIYINGEATNLQSPNSEIIETIPIGEGDASQLIGVVVDDNPGYMYGRMEGNGNWVRTGNIIHITGSGKTEAEVVPPSGPAMVDTETQVRLFLELSLETSYPVSISGAWSVLREGPIVDPWVNNFARGTVKLREEIGWDLGEWIFLNDSIHSDNGNGSDTFSWEGYLGPGLYDFELDIWTRSDVNGVLWEGNASIQVSDVTIRVGEVPIPGAVWLLGSGLIGIVGIRRKFKN